jgi:hypothetical protein
MYNLLFKSVSETLLELAKGKKYLDAEIGITAILHTWEQNLMYHPHIHCIVPSGGLSNLGNKWNNSLVWVYYYSIIPISLSGLH